MDIKDLREAAGMNRAQFAAYFCIPYRTVENWETGARQIPSYLLELMVYKLQKEGLVNG